ncbi:MAG: exodeoxyribonuclease V subunit gamma [Mycobacterium sp.]
MTLYLHRAERTDLLADGLGELLSAPPADPFAEDLVLVPARGVERWLSQRLSHVLGRGQRGDGVCAGVTFRSPRSLIAEITGTVDEDPWAPDALAWPLLEAIDENLDQAWSSTLATHLGALECGHERELRQGRRYAVARRIAGLFASYATQRPRLLADWSAGEPTDGAGAVLPGDLAWQPPLWSAVAAKIDADSPIQRHTKTVAALRDSPTSLPARLSLFGHTRLPVTDIELLEALATHHELHLWLPHPSDRMWQALAADGTGPVRRRTDISHHRVGHPLLATLGRDLRELQRTLPPKAKDQHVGDAAKPDTLLGWLQSDLSANAIRAAGRSMASDDRSVQVHSCHGQARQVAVLREVLLGLLADDPTLEPRDILVMCPDIETYAPLIVAGFGLGDMAHAHPAHSLRVRLADRSLAQTNPLLGVAGQLLSLAGGRATASEVLSLAHSAPVRARFGFVDDDLEHITDWVRESGVRWGFDRRHRKPYALEGFVQNTWRFGLDRILVGVAMSDDSRAWLDATLPLDDVSSNRVELAGRFTEFVDRLVAVVDSLTEVAPLHTWLSTLQAGVAFLTRAEGDDAWQAAQLQREFADVLADAGARSHVELRLPDVRALLGGRLSGRPTRVNFRTGTLTVCTMVPMRSVPHRVVCLIGLDDGRFPRLGLVDGDDVLARDPLTGERDIRSEDRQLLLDAVGAATEKLVITYTGANEHTGQPRPPAVPLVELLDALDATTSVPVRERVIVSQPLQPFDIRNVTPGQLGAGPHPFTFDQTALVAARVAASDRPAPPKFLDGSLPPRPHADIALDDLLRFFGDPVKGFFSALDFTLPWDVDGVQDAIPVEIDELQRWSAGDRMLADMLSGMNPQQALGAEWRRGTLPPGRMGWRVAREIRDQGAELAKAALARRASTAVAYDVDIDLNDGRRLSGTVAPVYGDRIVTVTFSKLRGERLLQPWIRLLALAAHDRGRDWHAVSIGRPKHGSRPLVRGLGLPDEAPVRVLDQLVALYDAGRREPLPLPLKTSYAWAEARHTGDDPERNAGFRWKTGKFPGEDESEAAVRVWGRHAPLDVLLGPPPPGEQMPGENTRLGALAARLWLPLLRSERDPE